MTALTVALSVLFGASPVSASDRVCGPYAPSQGRITTSHDGDRIHVTASFRLSQYQLDMLRCSADYLELSYWVYNVTIDADSEDYEIYSNLPGATHDVGFEDGTFSPGITVIPTSELQSNTPYYGTVEFNSGVTNTPYVSVGFSPSHWSDADDVSLKESGSCVRGRGRNPAWCIFPTDTTMLNQPYGGAVPVINGGKYPYDSGRYDLPYIG